MTRISDSFTWPLRARATTWVAGAVMVLFSPVLFIPLFGYAVAATRAAKRAESPPPFAPSWQLLSDGFWTALAVALTLAPFAIVFVAVARVAGGVALAIAFFALALPWGLIALLVLPHATVAFATSGRPGDLFRLDASLRGVRRDFASWNLAVAAIVTAWAIGLASVALLCLGIVAGIFYAILVSAHAAATLTRSQGQSRRPPAG